MNTNFEITSTIDDDSVVLDDNMALMHAQETLCPNNQVMILRYKTVKTTLNDETVVNHEFPESGSTATRKCGSYIEKSQEVGKGNKGLRGP